MGVVAKGKTMNQSRRYSGCADDEDLPTTHSVDWGDSCVKLPTVVQDDNTVTIFPPNKASKIPKQILWAVE